MLPNPNRALPRSPNLAERTADPGISSDRSAPGWTPPRDPERPNVVCFRLALRFRPQQREDSQFMRLKTLRLKTQAVQFFASFHCSTWPGSIVHLRRDRTNAPRRTESSRRGVSVHACRKPIRRFVRPGAAYPASANRAPGLTTPRRIEAANPEFKPRHSKEALLPPEHPTPKRNGSREPASRTGSRSKGRLL